MRPLVVAVLACVLTSHAKKAKEGEKPDWAKEEVMAATKKGKTIMLFAKINKFTDKHETEEVSSLWHTGLYNAHIHGERFLVEDRRVMFSFKDGSYAWEAKDFLIEQERVEDVQLEGKAYKGKYA